jgi:hypothetical protein
MLQNLFVAETYGHDDKIFAVQNAISCMFGKTFLAYKTLVVPSSTGRGSEQDLTPSKSQRKLFLAELKHLVMKPMICKCLDKSNDRQCAG